MGIFPQQLHYIIWLVFKQMNFRLNALWGGWKIFLKNLFTENISSKKSNFGEIRGCVFAVGEEMKKLEKYNKKLKKIDVIIGIDAF